MKLCNLRKIEKAVYLVLALSFLLETPHIVVGSAFFCISIQAPMDISSPLVTLNNATANVVIYTNNTSAKVTVSNNTENLDVLETLNQTSDNWQLQLIAYNDANINRLINCTIWFHDGTASVQIKIINGEYTQTSGEYYNLVGSGADRITLTASTNATGTSYINAYLKILKPNTSTYYLYIITFEIVDS